MTLKTVGRSVPQRLPPDEAIALQDAMAEMYEERAICARGVFRFRSFQEADEWLRNQMVRKALEHRRGQTSLASPRASTSRESDTR